MGDSRREGVHIPALQGCDARTVKRSAPVCRLREAAHAGVHCHKTLTASPKQARISNQASATNHDDPLMIVKGLQAQVDMLCARGIFSSGQQLGCGGEHTCLVLEPEGCRPLWQAKQSRRHAAAAVGEYERAALASEVRRMRPGHQW